MEALYLNKYQAELISIDLEKYINNASFNCLRRFADIALSISIDEYDNAVRIFGLVLNKRSPYNGSRGSGVFCFSHEEIDALLYFYRQVIDSASNTKQKDRYFVSVTISDFIFEKLKSAFKNFECWGHKFSY